MPRIKPPRCADPRCGICKGADGWVPQLVWRCVDGEGNEEEGTAIYEALMLDAGGRLPGAAAAGVLLRYDRLTPLADASLLEDGRHRLLGIGVWHRTHIVHRPRRCAEEPKPLPLCQ